MSSKPETINIMPGFRKDLCALIHFASDAIASLSFSFFLAIAVANASHAQQVVFEGCVDVRGIPVASIPAPIDDIAVAKLDPSGSPVILYSPQIAAEYDMATRLFFYFHECGHHALGHSLRRQPASEEQQADCWAIRTLVSRGLFSDRDISQVQADIAHFGKSDWTHIAGPQRAILLRKCLSEDSTRENAVADTFAPVLQTIISTAPHSFESIRDRRDPDDHDDETPTYSVIRRLPDAEGDCSIFGGQSPSYVCTMTTATDQPIAEESYDQLAQLLLHALSQHWHWHNSSGGHVVKGRQAQDPSGTRVRLEMAEKSNRFTVRLWIDASDKHERKNQ